MAKEFDIQVLNTTIMGVVEATFEKICHVKPSAAPVVVQKDIIEYQSRMRVFPMEKFNAPAYISVINYYLSQKDMDTGNAVGTFVLFVKEDYMDKFLKGFGRSAKDSEDPEVLLDICGEVANIIAGNVKNELMNLGYADLFLSSPFKYRNNVPEGVQFHYGLYTKQELSFTFWNQRSIVIEACMAHVPLKGK